MRNRRDEPYWHAIRDRLAVSIALGVLFAGVLALWVTAVRIFGGRSAFEELGASYPVVVLTYLGSGVVGGIIVGLLLPITRWRVGVAFVGFLVGVATFSAVGLSITGFEGWSSDDVLIAILGGLALGPVLAFQIRRHFHE